MNTNKLWMLGSLLISGVILLAGWFIGVSPMLASAASSELDLAATRSTNAAHAATLDDLTQRSSELPALKAESEALQQEVPLDADLSDFIRSINGIQEQTGTVVTDLTVSDGIPFSPVVPEVEPVASTGDAEADAAAASAATDIEAVASSGASSQLLTPENFTAVPVTVAVDGTLEQVLAFIDALQSGQRVYLVTDLAVAQDATTGIFTATIDGLAWVLLDASSAPAAPADPTAATTAELN